MSEFEHSGGADGVRWRDVNWKGQRYCVTYTVDRDTEERSFRLYAHTPEQAHRKIARQLRLPKNAVHVTSTVEEEIS